jgi:hypothetical protein
MPASQGKSMRGFECGGNWCQPSSNPMRPGNSPPKNFQRHSAPFVQRNDFANHLGCSKVGKEGRPGLPKPFGDPPGFPRRTGKSMVQRESVGNCQFLQFLYVLRRGERRQYTKRGSVHAVMPLAVKMCTFIALEMSRLRSPPSAGLRESPQRISGVSLAINDVGGVP